MIVQNATKFITVARNVKKRTPSSIRLDYLCFANG